MIFDPFTPAGDKQGVKPEPAMAARQSWSDTRVVIAFDARQPLLGVRELWSYREVLYALVSREVKVRYAQTLAGATWVILQPLLTTGVLSILAGRWMRVPAGDLEYPLFVYSGLVPWMYFTHLLTKSSMSLVNTGLLSKAYFPRLLLPLAVVIGGLIDLVVTSMVLAGLMIYYGALPSATIVLLPGALLLALAVAFGVVWLSVLNLFHRDVAHALPFATQLLFFITPVPFSEIESLHRCAGEVVLERHADASGVFGGHPPRTRHSAHRRSARRGRRAVPRESPADGRAIRRARPHHPAREP
jgi:ABC-type polysaccharide/polyol phosphate export permease